ncbi:MAG: hypothetical protein JSV00_10740, partial [bacterium]
MKRRILAFFIVLILTGVTVGLKLGTSPALDRWVQRYLTEQAEKHLGVRVRLGSFERNLFLTRISMTDVTLRDLKGSGKSITASRLVVAIDPYAFFRGVVHLKTLQLEGLYLDVVRNQDGSVSVEPIFPFWQTVKTDGKGKRGIPLALDVGNVILMDVGATYTDVPGGLKLALDDVVITLTKGRFDPKSRRNVSIRAGTGDLQWRIFPKGRKVVIESLDSEIVYSPEEILISRLSLATGPLKLELTGRVPRDRADDLSGNLLLKVALEKLPWLLSGSSGEVSLLGGVGGSIASPSFRGQLSSSDLRLAGRQLEGLEA